jgi:serine/threonine-protein kinase
LVLSLGKERYDVPKVQGLDVDHAQDALRRAHLTYGHTVPRWSDTVPRGTVLASTPAQGTRQRPSTVVDLVVSRGPRPVHLTDWTGKDAARAERALTGQRLDVQTREEYSDRVPEGRVISQDPPTGVLHHGDTVQLVVSKGPHLVEVPGGLRAMGVDAATQTLEDLGFKVEVDHADLYLGLGFVASSTPSGGDLVPKGSTVVLHIV